MNHYLLAKEPEKITSFANSIPSKCFKFASRRLESSLAHWVKCTYRKLRSVLGMLQKNSWCARGGHKLHLFQQHHFTFNVCKIVANNYSKEQGLEMDQERGKL